jgi:S-DNA-T family DNA segregation ATPase FtsK/SpoIIIE
VNVITGTIKSNIPTRIAFAVAQANDSRVILDGNGAEDLLGRGDLLIAESGNKIRRVQGAFVSDDEVARVVEAAKAQAKPRYLIEEDALDKRMERSSNLDDPLEQAAILIFIEEQKASVSLLQRKLNIGYNRAAKLVDHLEDKGFISEPIGATSKRDVLLTKDEFSEVFDEMY